MQLNINENVSFVLTKFGEKVLHAEYDERIQLSSEKNKEYWREMKEKRVEGTTIWMPLWKAMQIFGPHIHIASESPFKDCIINIEETQ